MLSFDLKGMIYMYTYIRYNQKCPIIVGKAFQKGTPINFQSPTFSFQLLKSPFITCENVTVYIMTPTKTLE